jgi:excisionase family DNA binding protein
VKPLARAVKPLRMKVLYSVHELAQSIGISRHLVMKLVRSQSIVVYRLGRTTLIPLTEIKEKLEPVWEAICLSERDRK